MRADDSPLEPPETDPISIVRRRPSLFFGSMSSLGKLEPMLEVASNAVDQYLQGHSTLVRVQATDHSFKIWDDGAGVSLNKARKHLTELHYTPTADRHAPHIHLGSSGVGLCPVNAVCQELLMTSYDAEGGWKLRFQQGRLVEETRCETLLGTSVEAYLDLEVASTEPLPLWKARRVLFDAVHLFPGLKVEFNAETFQAVGGLEDLARFTAAHHKQALWQEDAQRHFGHIYQGETLMFTLACYGTVRDLSETTISSWVNGLLSPDHGTHVDGVLDVLKATNWAPATVMLSVVMKEPQYAGPTKDKLQVKEVRSVIRESVLDSMACKDIDS